MQVYKNIVMANEYQSSKLCEALYTTCEEKMDQLQVLRLPSMAKFNAGFDHCNRSFEQECVGPSKNKYEMRMKKVCNCPPVPVCNLLVFVHSILPLLVVCQDICI